jgi:phospholipase C
MQPRGDGLGVLMSRLLFLAAIGMALVGVCPAEATTAFRHIVIIVQENRTPDNLFQGLCTTPGACSRTPSATQYDIQTANWLTKEEPSGIIQPVPVDLANTYDLAHTHTAFVAMCDFNSASGQCKMDGAGGVQCSGPGCPTKPVGMFAYVDNSSGILNPYLALATQYGWANYMFQTNQGPSFPAHQFLFGATSAPSAADDRLGTFVAENVTSKSPAGCIAYQGVTVQLIDSAGVEDPSNVVHPCFEHPTVADLLAQRGLSWRYYAPSAGSIWTAPTAINHLCKASGQNCLGKDFTQNVDLKPSDVLNEIALCELRDVSWVIPTRQNSDHAGTNNGGGPSWVASIVNAIGSSSCWDGIGTSYWRDTAILVTWDDWGGWYDHEPPMFLAPPQGGYQLGFRVPFIFISAYTPPGTISNVRFDFGSVARFIEHNFSAPEGTLGFADARSKTDLGAFYNLSNAPRQFVFIPAPLGAGYFLNDKSPQLPPDDD